MRPNPERRELIGAVGATVLAVAAAGCGDPDIIDEEDVEDDDSPGDDLAGSEGPGASNDEPPHENDGENPFEDEESADEDNSSNEDEESADEDDASNEAEGDG